MKHILLIGHGSHDEDGISEFHEMTKQVQQKLPHMVIRTCFLELAEPDILSGVEASVEAGAEEVIAIPIILSSARHYNDDIPETLHQAWAKYPQLTIRYGKPLGNHLMLVHALIDQIRQIKEASSILLVSQGSSLHGGNDAAEKLAGELGKHYPNTQITNAYMVMTKPTLQDGLLSLDKQEGDILVVPNFLFSGTMYKKIHKIINGMSSKQTVRVATCYGLSENFIDLVVDRILCPVEMLERKREIS